MARYLRGRLVATGLEHVCAQHPNGADHRAFVGVEVVRGQKGDQPRHQLRPAHRHGAGTRPVVEFWAFFVSGWVGLQLVDGFVCVNARTSCNKQRGLCDARHSLVNRACA